MVHIFCPIPRQPNADVFACVYIDNMTVEVLDTHNPPEKYTNKKDTIVREGEEGWEGEVGRGKGIILKSHRCAIPYRMTYACTRKASTTTE